MATPSQRRIDFHEIRKFGSQNSAHEIPDLTVLQTQSYKNFLQEDVSPRKRKNQGLESVLREIFPIETYDKSTRLEYLYYELEKPRYEPDECRQLRLTYGKPFKVRLRLVRDKESVEEDVYLGDIPIMLGGGEFIINGAERVVVSQLHRSPGIDFVSEMDTERRTYACRVIPERGSWIELNITRKETISAKIDQSSKLPIMMLLRAMSEDYSTDTQILRAFYTTTEIAITAPSKKEKDKEYEGKIAVGDIVYPPNSDKAGEIIAKSGEMIDKAKAEFICTSGLKKIEVMDDPKNKLILKSLDEDKTKSHEEALLRIYQRLRPGNPAQLDKAKVLFREKFYDTNRYRLGRVGRFRINRKLNTDITDANLTNFTGLWDWKEWKKNRENDKWDAKEWKEWNEVAGFWEKFHRMPRKQDEGKKQDDKEPPKYLEDKELPQPCDMHLLPDDIVHAVIYLSRLWAGDGSKTQARYSPATMKAFKKNPKGEPLPPETAEIDDIDHLGNRRLRTIDELAGEELRKGFLKLRRTVQERLANRGDRSDDVTPRQVINQKSISAAIEYFFGRGELSQVVDQTNPLSMLTHERRLSALGPGGLNRKRAGFDVRDVHSSHYGRICPIETPEGTNIGLISSLSIYAAVDEFGFLISPYCKLDGGKVTEQIDWLRADEEHEVRVAPADISIVSWEKISTKVDTLEWSYDRFIKAKNCFDAFNISTIGDYLGFSDDEIKRKILKHYPITTWQEIKDKALDKLGVTVLLEKKLAEIDLAKLSPQLKVLDGAGIKTVRDLLIRTSPLRQGVLVRDIPSIDESQLNDIKDKVVDKVGLTSILAIPVAKLELCFPIKQFLEEAKIVTLGNLIVKTEDSLRKGTCPSETELKKTFHLTESVAKKTMEDIVQEINAQLRKSRLRLGIDPEHIQSSAKNSHSWAIPEAISETLIVRYDGDYEPVMVDEAEYIDVSPSQMVGVSAGLIPFLEHDDANRALMGSNMQRQAVPLLVSEPALVATGLEGRAAFNSSLLIHAKRGGTIKYVDSQRIVIAGENKTDGKYEDEYVLRKFVGLNERTCQNQIPVVKPDVKIADGQIIADGASMHKGELCLGRNVLVAFMVWDGYNFEDAIIISEDLVKKDTYTSIHIEEFDIEIRDTKLGREEFTNDIPNVGEKALRNLDENGIVRVGTYVKQGDILVGKVTPKSKTELTPEEKLLHAIFGRAGEEVKNESLEVPSGIEGIVISTQKFSCRMSLSESERKAFDAEVNRIEKEEDAKISAVFDPMIHELEKALGKSLDGQLEQPKLFRLEHLNLDDDDPKRSQAETIFRKHWPGIESAVDAKDRKINSMKRGDELRRGVLQMVKVYVAAKRVISVGDKMAGRHGNKGVIAKILPREDMPFLEDGTPVEIMLNPLGVPSRMNVGQILETHLGWAAAKLGYQAVTPVFDGATEADINECLEEAGLPKHGKVKLYDGRTGEPFDQETTVGYIYMLKLHHLVDDKVHARSTGPYSLITQQPLGGKARSGGQRFGEMEVWALEAYGAAYTLQELLTVKSDDVEGRTKIYESMVKGENTLEAGTPASFDVLTNEIRGLALNMQLEKRGGV